MTKRKFKFRVSGGEALVAFLAIIAFPAIFAAIGALCWPYTINHWLEFFHKSPRIMWWEGALLAFVPYVGRLSPVLAIFTWLLLMFLN